MTKDLDERLELSPEAMRELGYRVIDLVVDNLKSLPSRPVSRTGSRDELERLLREPPPDKPRDPTEVLERTRDIVLGNMIHVDHPRNFGYVPGPSNFVGVLGDLLATGFNVFAGTWLEGSGAAEVELVTLDWLKALLGLPETAGGVFVSGGSAANLTGLAVARAQKLPAGPALGTWYASDQTHSSVERAFRVLGFRSDQARRIRSDATHRLPLDGLEKAVEADRSRGLVPFAVVANAGTTNTGAVDPLPELAALRDRLGLWLHVDGAYGAAAALSPKAAPELEGLGSADSISLDPHKWLFQPYGIGCALLRDGELLEETFRVKPAYLKDVEPGREEVNFADAGIELTRRFRALKLWLTIQLFGLENLRAAVNRGLELAEHAEAAIRKREELELTSEAKLGIVSFRYPPRRHQDADAFQLGLARAVVEDGYALVSSTVLANKAVLRMCCINPRTSLDDVTNTVDRVVAIARRLDEA